MNNMKISTPDDNSWVEITYKSANKVNLDCFMQQSDIIPLAYALRDSGLPAVDIDVFPTQMPSGRIILMFDKPINPQSDDRHIESISTAFEQYFDRRISTFPTNQLGLVPGVV